MKVQGISLLVKKHIFKIMWLMIFMLCFIHQQDAVAEVTWPGASVVLMADIPVVHTPHGLKLIDEAAFVDANSRLQVPLRFLAEELGASVEYQAALITVRRGESTVILELGKSEATVNQKVISLDTEPQLRGNRTFVPLRFLSEALGFQVHYQDQVIVVGSWFADVSSAEAASWKTGILSRWEAVGTDWMIEEIQIKQASLASEQFSFFWRYLGDNRYALYQSQRSNPDMAMCITDDLIYNNNPYGQEGSIYPFSFYYLDNACYAVLHTGGATMGSEYLYRFSSDHGSRLLLQDRMSGFLALWDDYIYYTESYFGGGATHRLHLPTTLSSGVAEPEEIGQPGYTYGYIILRSDSRSSGGSTGFCIADGYLYANGFVSNAEKISRADMAFYRIDLQTMEHEKLQGRLILQPQVSGGYVYEYDGFLYRTKLSDGSQELLYRNVADYYLDGEDIVWQEVINTEDWTTMWQRQPVTSLQPLEAALDPAGGVALSGHITISFDFERQTGSASNQYAVWVENEAGDLIKTLYATQWTAQGGYKTRPDSLFNWVTKVEPSNMPQSEIDAISGATPATGRQSYDWDFTDSEGNIVSPGEYRFVIEGTIRWRNHILYPYFFEISARGLGSHGYSPRYNYEASDQHPALDDGAAETKMISNLTILYTP